MKYHPPYQPLLFRLLHGLTALFLIAAIVTAAWTYDVYDGRWGSLSLPSYQEIEGIHGTFGLYTLLIFPAFILYAFHRGQQRLVHPNSLAQLTKLGHPIWWYTLNRLINTLALLALTFALFSGKMMDEKWLPAGELGHFWYSTHLISWVGMVIAIMMHLLINAKVGGVPLLLSVVQWHCRVQDSPKLWSRHLVAWWQKKKLRHGWDWFYSTSAFPLLELAIFISLFTAWIMPFL